MQADASHGDAHGDGEYDTNPTTENTEVTPEKYQPGAFLRYRWKSLWIFAVYVLLLLVPWVADCVLMYRSFNSAGYSQRQGLPPITVLTADSWMSAYTILNRIQTLLAIPIVSGLLAEAAVVYSQRRVPGQELSIRQLSALADRSWADLPRYLTARHEEVGSRLVSLGGLLILLVSIQAPLQSLLVGTETVQVMTCEDQPTTGCGSAYIPQQVGFDPEPSDMQYLPYTIPVQRVSSKIMSVSDMDVQPHMWSEQWVGFQDPRRAAKSTFNWYYDASIYGYTDKYAFFVSSLPNGTDTGVLRQLSMRINTTSGCTNVPQSNFPLQCSGRRPFTSNFSLLGMEVSICAPGAYDEIPWTLSRDRQDISEDLWIDVSIDADRESYMGGSFTLHCTANSTREYFEVPNIRTEHNPGPLLERWPSVEEMETDWNDVLGRDAGSGIPTVIDNYTNPDKLVWPSPASVFYTAASAVAPGPLMISTLAMFGNNSWWYTVHNTSTIEAISRGVQSICQAGNIPFTMLSLRGGFKSAGKECRQITLSWGPGKHTSDEQYEDALFSLVYLWFSALNDPQTATDALSAATYFANEAVLTATADGHVEGLFYSSKWIYSSQGRTDHHHDIDLHAAGGSGLRGVVCPFDARVDRYA